MGGEGRKRGGGSQVGKRRTVSGSLAGYYDVRLWV